MMNTHPLANVTLLTYAMSIMCGLITILIMRLSVCFPQYRRRANGGRTSSSNRGKQREKVKTLIVFGSGGHTAEMLTLITDLSTDKYQPMHYVLSNTDTTSKGKINAVRIDSSIVWHTLIRSREVKQSWLTTIWTSTLSLIHSLYLVITINPDLIICNGPGTCVPICYSSFFMRVMGLHNSKIVFVESFCRVKDLSLSGKLLYPIADKFIVQWPALSEKYRNCEYLGKIC